MARKDISKNPLFKALNLNEKSQKRVRSSNRSNPISKPSSSSVSKNQNPLAQRLGIKLLPSPPPSRGRKTKPLRAGLSVRTGNGTSRKERSQIQKHDGLQLLSSTNANSKSINKSKNNDSKNQVTFLPSRTSRDNAISFPSSTINNSSSSSLLPTGPSSSSSLSPNTIHLLRMRNLTPQVTKHDVINIMGRYGTILTVLLKKDYSPVALTPSATAELFYLDNSSLATAKKELHGRKADGRLLVLEIDTRSKIISDRLDWQQVLEDVKLSRTAEVALQQAEEARLKAEVSRERIASLYERAERASGDANSRSLY